MRKPLTLLLALSLTLLCGCDARNYPMTTMHAASVNESPNGPVGIIGSTPTFAETYSYTLDTEVKSDAASGEDGTPLFQYSYSIPVLRVETQSGERVETASGPAEKLALATADAFNINFTDWVASVDFESLAQWAQEDYTYRTESGMEWSQPYTEDFSYSTWQSDRLVSVVGEFASYTGGAHYNFVTMAWNFDLQTGRFLHPTAVGVDSQKFQEAVTKEIVAQADARAAENGMAATEMFWPEYRDIIAQWSDYAVSFSDEGMTVAFSPYELAAFAAGAQTFTVGGEFLSPYLSEDGRAMLGMDAP